MAITAIPFAFPGVPRVRCLFSTRAAGDMARRDDPAGAAAGAANRAALMRLAGLREWAELRQVHGIDMVPAAPCDPKGEADPPAADGHFVDRAGVGLVIKTADCQPLFFARIDGGTVAGLHVGWRGNAAGFPGTAVARLCGEFGCAPTDLVAVRGPSLGPAASEFVNFDKEWPEEFRPWYRPGDRTVNLWALTRCQLERAGLRPDRIFSLDMCTRDMPEWFFSHRRGDAGRQIGLVWMA